MKENRLGDSRHDKPPRQISVPLQYHREKQQYHRFQFLLGFAPIVPITYSSVELLITNA
jgi:hypothetical protein